MIFEAMDLFNWQVRKYVSCLKMTQWLPTSGHKKQNSIFKVRILSVEHVNLKRH